LKINPFANIALPFAKASVNYQQNLNKFLFTCLPAGRAQPAEHCKKVAGDSVLDLRETE